VRGWGCTRKNKAGEELFPPGFFHLGDAHCQDFFRPFFFRNIPDAGFGKGGFVTHHEIVHETKKNGLGGLGGDVAGRGFFFVEFIFELIEHFFQIPAPAVEQDDEAGLSFRWWGIARIDRCQGQSR